MRKLKFIEHISLDGVIQVSGEDGAFPCGDWTASYRTPAGRDAIIAAHGQCFGRLVVAEHVAALVGIQVSRLRGLQQIHAIARAEASG